MDWIFAENRGNGIEGLGSGAKEKTTFRLFPLVEFWIFFFKM